MEVQAQGKTFTFPDGTSNAQVGEAVDDYFMQNPTNTQMTGEADYAGSGIIEPAMAMASGMVAEPLAGLAGIGMSAVEAIFDKHRNKSAAQVGVDAINSTREALTYRPRTQSGIENMQSIGETLAPVGEALQGAEEYLADTAYDATDSPLAAATASTLPTLAMTLLGIRPVRNAAKTVTGINKLQGMRTASKQSKAIDKAILKGAPEVSDIKKASSNLYQQLDDSGTVIKKEKITNLSNEISGLLEKKGYHPKQQPLVKVVLDEFALSKGSDIPLSRLNQLREFASTSAADLNPKTSMLGKQAINKIDNFMDGISAKDLKSGSKTVGAQYKQARDLWGRNRRSETMSNVLEQAENAASGTENGIRIEVRKLLRSKKKSKFFTKDEIVQLKKIADGTHIGNLAKAIGKFGFDISKATNTVGGTIGAGIGSVAGGLPAAIAVPAVGTASRVLAKHMTKNNHAMADAVIRAGKNGRKVTKEYLTKIPKPDQNPKDLATMLINSESSLVELRKMPLTSLPKKQRLLIKDALFYVDAMQQGENDD